MNQAKQSQSDEVSSLNAEDIKLKTDIAQLRKSEDLWNTSNRWLSFLAVATGALFGLGAFFAQRSAANMSSHAQPLIQRREQISERLQSISDQEYKTGIALAGTAASTANLGAQQAILEQVKLSASNLQLQATIEQERTARVQLLKTLAYRTLNMGELGAIRRATYAYKAAPLDILYCVGDPEVGQFAARIENAFDIWKPNIFPISSFIQPGLTVEFDPNDPQASEAAQHFFEALNHHGFRVNGPFPELPWTPKELLVQTVPQAKLRIVVGERDPVYLPTEERK